MSTLLRRTTLPSNLLELMGALFHLGRILLTGFFPMLSSNMWGTPQGKDVWPAKSVALPHVDILSQHPINTFRSNRIRYFPSTCSCLCACSDASPGSLRAT